MAFQKYEVATATKPAIDVKISPNGIGITLPALQAHNLAETDYVNLFWDSELHLIGLSASDKGDKSAFKIATRGRGQGGKFVAASKFFDKFGINVEEATVAGSLHESDGIAAFPINLPTASEVKPYTGKRRGRKPKAAAEAA